MQVSPLFRALILAFSIGIPFREGIKGWRFSEESRDERGQMPGLIDDRRLTEPERRIRQRIMDAMLVCSGKFGFLEVTPDRLCREAAVDREELRRHYDDLDGCFHAAYSVEGSRLCHRILRGSGSGGDLPQALDELATYIVAEPMQAKALFLEVHFAGGRSLEKRQELMIRLSKALDAAYRSQGSSVSEIASIFFVHAIDQSVCASLAGGEPERFRIQVPELLKLVSEGYSDGRHPRKDVSLSSSDTAL